MLRGLFRTKNLDDILAALGDESRSLKRSLGPVNITLLGIGAIIGAGIFATVGTAAAGYARRRSLADALVWDHGRGLRFHRSVGRGFASERILAPKSHLTGF